MAVQIIAQVGDTHALKFADMGKRRFLRLGASEKVPDLMQGTLHTGPVFRPDAKPTPMVILGRLGLWVFKSSTAKTLGGPSSYFITGAIVYSVSGEDGERVGILTSIREAPIERNMADGDEAQLSYAAEFYRQYPAPGEDNSVAKELMLALRKYAHGEEIVATLKERPTSDQRAERIAKLQEIRDEHGGLTAAQHAELDRLLNLQRTNGNEPEADEDDEPQMLTGRLD